MNIRHTYFTIRCPWGCEAWLHPRTSMPDHLQRCARRPWVDEIPEVAVIPFGYSSLIADAVDASLLGTVSEPGSTRVSPGDGRGRRPVPIPAGFVTVATPIEGVRARRWLTVALAAIDTLGEDALHRALEPTTFHDLEAEVLYPGAYTECPTCGAFVSTRGLSRHQASNAACAWRRAADDVGTAWQDGWRDPYSLGDVPITWVELTAKKHWRDQLRTIVFPRWIAVLLPMRRCGMTTGLGR